MSSDAEEEHEAAKLVRLASSAKGRRAPRQSGAGDAQATAGTASASVTVDDILREERLVSSRHLSQATCARNSEEICVVQRRGNHLSHVVQYDAVSHTYRLRPDEALFLLGRGALQLSLDTLVLSLQQAYAHLLLFVPNGNLASYVPRGYLRRLGYTIQHGREERRFFRRFYKFQVLNPLSVKTKVNNQASGRVFLEVQVQNLTVSPMCLDRIYLEAADGFSARDLNLVLDRKPDDDTPLDEQPTVFGDTEFLQPQDIRQYLFLLTADSAANDPAARNSNALGKLDIVWRTTFGEFGRLQTSQLTRRLPALDRIQATTTHVDSPVLVERPFRVQCRITNRSDASMRLQLSAARSRMGAILLNGQASRLLGNVEPGAAIDATLEFLPLASGLQSVGGLKLTDLISGENRDIELTDVFVRHSGLPEASATQ